MKISKLILLFVPIFSLIVSCDNFLSEIPDNRALLNTPDKISELLVNAYPKHNYQEFVETMTDNVFDTKNLPATTERNTRFFYWQDSDEVQQDSPAIYWDACYQAIAHANQALSAINQGGNNPKLNPQKGEALLARAYAHFMLVSIWSQRYNPATAATDLGIPYVSETEIKFIKKYERQSVEKVYEFIEKDIEEGLKYITNTYKHKKFHFNKEAANAFAVRFYTVKGDWKRVIELSDDLGNLPIGKLRDYQAFSLLDATTRLSAYADVSQVNNLLIASVNSLYANSVGKNRFGVPKPNYDQIFGKSSNLFNKEWLYSLVTSNGSVNVMHAKYFSYEKIVNVMSNTVYKFAGVILFSNEELFFNRIEAHVMINDFQTANQEIEYFLSTRTDNFNNSTDKVTEEKIVNKYPLIENEYTPFYQLSSKQASYIKAIAELKRIEFLHEGLRWFDIKRFALQVTHTQESKPVDILLKDDKRKAFQIPLHVSIDGMEKNPR